ncbi:hypothetical protein GCM10023149_43550 [Mucilaginibacter gynuensis]|uniref:Bacterial mobilisation domain-containing protein n=1 Tax=Mucilaginibacter gynuensis TaxID=1302236 RepID=A0ABP8H7I7_9SPHI
MKKLEVVAQLCGKAPGLLMRERFFKGRLPEPKTAKLDYDTYFELKKIGVNINQLAKRVNSHLMPVGILSVLNRLLKQQEAIIKLLLDDSHSENW